MKERLGEGRGPMAGRMADEWRGQEKVRRNI